jgi:ABC-type amino acid transport substrate-binding protein
MVVGAVCLFLVVMIGSFALAVEYDILVGEDLPTFLAATSWGAPPFVWVDGQGRYVGFDADILRSMAIIEGFNLEKPLDMDFAGLVPALIAKKYDKVSTSAFKFTSQLQSLFSKLTLVLFW